MARAKAVVDTEAKVRLPKVVAEHEYEVVALADLQAAPYNPRTITAKAQEGLRASMRRFGNVQPIIVNKRTGNLVGGHQRVALLRESGETHTKAVIVDLSLKDEKALNIALNSDKIQGQFDIDRLGPLLLEIQSDDADLFRDLNLDDLLTIPEIDDVPTGSGIEKTPLQMVVSYQIVFDDEAQQNQWYTLLSKLKDWYPNLDTMGARIAQYAQDAIDAAKEPA